MSFGGMTKLREREKLKKLKWVHNNTKQEQKKQEDAEGKTKPVCQANGICLFVEREDEDKDEEEGGLVLMV